MKKLPLILGVGSVALFLGGCPSSSPTNQSQPITQESPTTPPPPANPSAAAPPSFSGATRPAEPAPSTAIAGLIPATDPDQKRAEIARGRVDPTALFPLNPEITIKATEEETTTTVTPSFPSPSSRPATSSARGRTVPASGSAATRVATRPAPSLPSLPPQPTEARGVQVSGIVQLPTTPMAIVKAPGERTERRVIPGSTLSNGTIVVRSIDTNPDDPSIVLEQYGQTVIRKLGAGMPTATTPTAPGAPTSQSAMIYPSTLEGGS